MTNSLSTAAQDYQLQVAILDGMKAQRENLQDEIAIVKANIIAQNDIVNLTRQRLKDEAGLV